MTEELENLRDCFAIEQMQVDIKIDIDELLELEGKYYNSKMCGKLPISSSKDIYSKMTSDDAKTWENKGFSREEAFILMLYIGFSSCWINTRLNNRKIKRDPLHKLVVKHLDFVLTKINPADGLTIYRMDKHKDPEVSSSWFTLNLKNVIQTQWFLSTSIEDFENTKVVWKIKTLPADKTKSRLVYQVYNHGNEKEVLFQRDACFLVKEVELEGNKLIVTLDETCDKTKTPIKLTNGAY